MAPTLTNTLNFPSFVTLLTVLLSLSLPHLTSATPLLHRRAILPHDAVIGFPQTVPNTTEGAAYLRYKPWLDVPHGCVPFPAVDALGNIGGGLSQSDGDHKNRCSRSLGQVYARGAWSNGTFAIMYSWYMPKDSPSIGLGHRHDWENIVVYLSSPSQSASPADQKIVALATSAHGQYKSYSLPHREVFFSSSPGEGATRVLIKYHNILFFNHHPDVTNKKGGEQPLVAWESLSAEARKALSEGDWGSATVPFKEGRFGENLKKGWSGWTGV